MAFVWAALGTALLHTLSPAHWLPYVAVGKTNRWLLARLLWVALGGIALHLVSTGVLLLLALLVNYGLSHVAGHALERVGAGLLLLLGLGHLVLPQHLARWSERMGWALAVSVGIQPCIEVIPLMLIAAASGVAATLVTGITWAVTTFTVSLVLVAIGYRGLQGAWVERALRGTRWILGGVLLLSGILALLHTH